MSYCRIDCFGTDAKGRACGWQGWNHEPSMEQRMARLPGSGSFYWESAREAYRMASRWLRSGNCRTVRINTISGREVCYLHAPEKRPAPARVLTVPQQPRKELVTG